LEFELFDFQGQARDVGFDFLDGRSIRLGSGKIEELCCVAERTLEAIQAADNLLELGPFPAEFLGAVRGVPDAGLLEFALYFLQTLVFVVVIKDTSSKSRCAPRDL
jgi:hypothetical protein